MKERKSLQINSIAAEQITKGCTDKNNCNAGFNFLVQSEDVASAMKEVTSFLNTEYQRRVTWRQMEEDGRDLYKSWAEYKAGFGDEQNFLLGNKKIFALTGSWRYRLRVDLTAV
ncbi:hypothetical protein DPMN_032487 [Dreissena polymorpha]|uniref:Fibrinogen C-terminal domain-containing protein n=1 Tax=Dreissena polymorpha TaxID=45954 RepID=A0A9D4RIA7_DREPO|nr:hypothetical protein DPMN_032487 [Dreissena polymorpha]